MVHLYNGTFTELRTLMEPKLILLDSLPEPPAKRNLAKWAVIARQHPGKWVQLPFEPDKHGSIVGNLKGQHKVDAQTVDGKVYCRQPG
jgi:hypothetical protein